ncbi:MAG: helix-turn-helix transcriptional regulator, partial [Treponema sp.]|nr:helix-turn-helix transcriptional regulator [Treponema sp.]
MQENLTPREQEILDLMLEGISTKEIAFKLSLSARTVDFHRNNINKKLNVGNYHELIAKYSSIKNRKDELISSADTQHKKPGKLYKFLIPAAVFILIGSIIPIWHFTEKASSLKPHEDMPVLNNTPVFKDHTYDTVYLKTSKIFVNTEKGYYGQSYYSYDEIFLRDFYSGT